MLEDIAVGTLVRPSFGTGVMILFQGFVTVPSWQGFTDLACGWALATDCHPIKTSLWRTGATTVKPCSRFSVFLGDLFDNRRWHLWGAVIRLAVQLVPKDEVRRVLCDDTTRKKAGTHIEGLARHRDGAGSARRAYRTLRGVNFVLGSRRVPLPRWPGHSRSVPIGLELSLKSDQAKALNGPGRGRSQLAHDSLDCLAAQVSDRPTRSLTDGGDATKGYRWQLPKVVHVVGHWPLSATRSRLFRR